MSWNQLLSIIKETRQEFDYYQATPPLSCPNDGEPLTSGPPGSGVTLFCKWDGWQYPRDWVRPERY